VVRQEPLGVVLVWVVVVGVVVVGVVVALVGLALCWRGLLLVVVGWDELLLVVVGWEELLLVVVGWEELLLVVVGWEELLLDPLPVELEPVDCPDPVSLGAEPELLEPELLPLLGAEPLVGWFGLSPWPELSAGGWLPPLWGWEPEPLPGW
jgi:hypothetical protein